MIGRPFQRGALENSLGIQFDQAQRRQANVAIDKLKHDGYITPTLDDLADPENWLSITDKGRRYLANGGRDWIDSQLALISEHLIEIRHGMKDAVDRTSPDAPRHAVNAARELIDQVLKGVAPEADTRRARIKSLMLRHRGLTSSKDEDIADATCRLVEAEHNKALALSHGRTIVQPNEAKLVVDACERTLLLLFGVEPPPVNPSNE